MSSNKWSSYTMEIKHSKCYGSEGVRSCNDIPETGLGKYINSFVIELAEVES